MRPHHAVCTLADLLLATRPTHNEDEASDDLMKDKVRDFEAALEQLRDGLLSDDSAKQYTELCQQLHRALMAKHRKENNLAFAKLICDNLLDHSS